MFEQQPHFSFKTKPNSMSAMKIFIVVDHVSEIKSRIKRGMFISKTQAMKSSRLIFEVQDLSALMELLSSHYSSWFLQSKYTWPTFKTSAD